MTASFTTPAKRTKKSDQPILTKDTDERIRRYEMRHSPEAFIRLYCNWNIRPWPYCEE